MSVLNIQTLQSPGLVGVLPSVIYIYTNDLYATVTATGYLTKEKTQGFTFSNNQMALVYTSDDGPVWLKVVITYSGATIQNTVVSLVQISSPGDVVLPTIANHLIVSTDTVGTLGNLTGTAINDGSIQAGRSTIAGTFISFPSSAANGSLILAAVNAGGAFNTTISNGTTGQSQVISIPDSGATTANFIISKFATTQHITVGALQVDAGVISSGLATGGTAGGFVAYPATTTNGSLRLTPVGNVGNFAATISNIVGLGQATVYTMPDPGASTANFLLSALTGAGTQHITSGSLEVDAGNLIAGLPTGGTAGGLILYPATTTNGSLRLAPVGNAGNFAATISDITGLGQASVYTLPDPANAIARILVGATATPFTTGHVLSSSGTGGLVADSGIATTNLQLKTDVKASTASVGGGGAGPISVVVAGLTASSILVATIASSSNTVAVAKCIGTATGFDVTFTGDPGAACVLNYIAYIVGQ